MVTLFAELSDTELLLKKFETLVWFKTGKATLVHSLGAFVIPLQNVSSVQRLKQRGGNHARAVTAGEGLMVNLARLPELDIQVLYSRQLETESKGSARE